MSDPVDPLAIAPDLPKGTPTAGEAAPPATGTPAAPPAPAAPPVELDKDGQPHDPRWHVVPPRKNVHGRWAGKPGNAGRAKAGKPPTGGGFATAPAPGGFASDAPKPPEAQPATDAPAAQAVPVQASKLVWDDTPAGAPGIEAQPVELRPREAYTATARSVVVAQFGIAQMAMGKAWDPEPAERKAWEQAWMDLMCHYQLPVVGPLLGLLILAIDSIAKRRNDQETKDRAKALWSALKGSFRRSPEPLPEPGHAQAQPVRRPQPADNTSAAYGYGR